MQDGNLGAEFAPCGAIAGTDLNGDEGVAQCACPMNCIYLQGVPNVFVAFDGGYCAFPCSTSDDCPDPITTCVAGYCQPTYCVMGPTGQPVGDGAEYGSVCNAARVNDGTCIEAVSQTISVESGDTQSTLGLCTQGGTSQGACSPLATRGQQDLLCPPGQYCQGISDGGGECVICAVGLDGSLQCGGS